MNTATDRSGPTIEERFLQFVIDAAQQDSFLSLDADDWDGEKTVGPTPIYAVDSNIVHMFINPSEMASSEESRSIGYGEVFRSDSTDKKSAITLALADFIWYDLSPERPLLIMPGVDREVASLIQVSASRTIYSPEVVHPIKKLQEELYAATGDKQRSIARELANRIINVKRGSRLMALERQKRFVPMDGIFDQGIHGFPSDVLDVLMPPSSIDLMIEYASLRREWEDLLRGRRGDPERQPVSRDIDALSYLEYWNRRLLRLAKPHRLVYITGDVAILRAASQRTAVDFRPTKVSTRRRSWTFLDAFIRHPRSLLDRPGVLRKRQAFKTKATEANSIRSWFRLLLGEYQDAEGNLGHWNWGERRFELTKEVEGDLLAVAAKRPEVLQEARKGWEGFTESVSLADLIDGNMFPKEVLDTDGDRDREYRVPELLEWLKKNGEEINKEVEKYWRDCVLAFTEFRFLLDIISKRPPTHRRAPQLCLAGEKPQKFLSQAKEWLADPKSFNAEAYEEFKKMRNDPDDEDGGDYNFLISIAFILASGGNWHSTAFLCAYARLVADRQNGLAIPKKIAGPNGREAAYLEAFSRRHLARKPVDLEVCVELIYKAMVIYTNEYNADRGSVGMTPPPGDPISERFNAERLAIDYTKQMLICGGQLQPQKIEPLLTLRAEFEEFLGKLDRADDADSACRNVLDLLRHRTLLNVVSIGVFLGRKNWDAGSALSYCERLQNVRASHADEEEFRSEYSDVVTWSGMALFGDPKHRREALSKALRGIDEVIESGHAREFGFSYDRARYISFKANLTAID